jgi:hypothetical protein
MGVEATNDGCFKAHCDCCGEIFVNTSGFSIYWTKEVLTDHLKNGAEWIDDNKAVNKWYCPECYKIESDDTAIVKTDPEIIITL